MKLLLILTAILEAPVGLLLLVAPSVFSSAVLGIELDTPADSVAYRVGGGAIFALAIACWQGRNSESEKASTAIVAAMLFYDVAVNAVLVHASTSLGIQSPLIWPVIVLHFVMGCWSVLVLVRSHREPETTEARNN